MSDASPGAPCAPHEVAVAKLQQKVDDHIDTCGDRYENIEKMFARVDTRLTGLSHRWWKVIWTVLMGCFALIAALLIYIWENAQWPL